MPLGGWIVFGMLAALITCIGAAIAGNTYEKKHTIAAWTLTLILIAALLVGMLAYYSKTESGKRAMKSWQSELNEGISREVRVYDVNGNLIQEYKGKFDVDYDDDRIIFDDQDGKRHVIYYPTGTVIIDEVE